MCRTWFMSPRADRNSLLHTLLRMVPLRVARDHDRRSLIDRLGPPQIVAKAAHIGGRPGAGRLSGGGAAFCRVRAL
jgi:hypothetical protein